MAFVFRSENKQPAPQPQPQIPQTQPTQSKDGKQKSVCKGLPHELYKPSFPIEKENTLPIMEASPIHPGSFTFTNSVFKVKSPISFNKDVTERGPFITQCGGKGQLPEISIGNKVQKSHQSAVSKPVTKLKAEKPIPVSKNLLKTMELLQSKDKEMTYKQPLQIDQCKEHQGKTIDKNRLRKWQSLRKLSPLRDLSTLDQSKEVNFSCCIGKVKEQQDPPSRVVQKQVKMKFNPRKLQDTPDDSDEEDEYDSQATPGPGAYTYQGMGKKEFRSKRKQFQKIFYSQIQRFKNSLKPYQQITYVNQNKEDRPQRKNSPCQSFLSKSPKFQTTQQAVSPEPGYYDTRQTLEHDLVRQILKSCNSTAFISRSPRNYKVNGKDLPGPGEYTLDRSLQKLMQERNQLNYSYKSHLDRNASQLKEHSKKKTQIEEESQPNNPIHIKQDSILEDLYTSEPVPFMSTSERFPLPKVTPSPNLSRPSKAAPTAPVKESREAFNSSEARQVFMKVGEGVGVGVYQLGRKGLVKRSFNVLFN